MLRGVNVGGVRVAMADLTSIGEAAGFSSVSTHLNSGNLLFTAATGKPADHARTISKGIEAAIGRPIPVIIRTPAELARALRSARKLFATADEARVAIAFLDRSAGVGAPDRLGVWDVEEYLISGAEVYLHYPNGQADTKLLLPVIEKRLSVTGTARGLKTVAGLIAKSGKFG